MINTDCDAAMQQTLFMRELAASQQEGFRIKSFEYREYPALRFIGVNMDTKGHRPGQAEVEMVRILDSMKEYRSGFDYDMILYHHFGRGINKEPCHALAGRFMAADTPVPEGAVSLDFVVSIKMMWRGVISGMAFA